MRSITIHSAPSRVALAVLVALAVVATMSGDAAAQARGVRLTPDGVRVLVNKDVGSERWAISRNADGTVTGNVFRSDGGKPAFIFCEGRGGNAFSCFGADPCAGEGDRRGIQRTPDGASVLANKDVGAERWAIALNGDGSVTGNVFRSDGGEPAFLHCVPTGAAHTFDCSGADACATGACAQPFLPIATVTLPADFFEVPAPCGASFTFIADVTLPPSFFEPPTPIRFTMQSAAGLQAFRVAVDYSLGKGIFNGHDDLVACHSTAANFIANSRDDGRLLLLAASSDPLPFPLEIICGFDPSATAVSAGDFTVSVLGVTRDASAGDPGALSVTVGQP